jgi:hypothetical protein
VEINLYRALSPTGYLPLPITQLCCIDSPGGFDDALDGFPHDLFSSTSDLSAFIGQGNVTLGVEDLEDGDVCNVDQCSRSLSFSLGVTYVSEVGEPSSYAIFLTGLVVLFGGWRRRSQRLWGGKSASAA